MTCLFGNGCVFFMCKKIMYKKYMQEFYFKDKSVKIVTAWYK